MFDETPFEYRDREPLYPETPLLILIGPDIHGRDAKMHPEAALAWRAMVDNAASDGARLLLVSAYRSIAYQAEIVRRKQAQGLSWAEILEFTAYPGFSEHHTGCAVDIASPACLELVERFELTPEFKWLSDNARHFGFSLSYPRGNRRGVAYEPWHWFWRAIEIPQ